MRRNRPQRRQSARCEQHGKLVGVFGHIDITQGAEPVGRGELMLVAMLAQRGLARHNHDRLAGVTVAYTQLTLQTNREV